MMLALRRRSSKVEQLICNQRVGGSIPLAGSRGAFAPLALFSVSADLPPAEAAARAGGSRRFDRGLAARDKWRRIASCATPALGSTVAQAPAALHRWSILR
jgi:hypothetical protein